MLRFVGDWTVEKEARHIVDRSADVVGTAQVPAQVVPIIIIQLAFILHAATRMNHIPGEPT